MKLGNLGIWNKVAVGKEQGKLRFDLGNETKETGWGGLSIENNFNSVEVDVCTLDDYTTQHNIEKIDFLKIDTEGADTWVLYGAKRLLKEKRIKHILFEENLSRMKKLHITPDEVKKFLNDVGYAVERFNPDTFYAYPKVVK
jgi:hypothetical protein